MIGKVETFTAQFTFRCDPVPGWGHQIEDFQALIEQRLRQEVGNYFQEMRVLPNPYQTEDDTFDFLVIADRAWHDNPTNKINAIKQYRAEYELKHGFLPGLLEAKREIEAAEDRSKR